jgi:hypothetical protein
MKYGEEDPYGNLQTRYDWSKLAYKKGDELKGQKAAPKR